MEKETYYEQLKAIIRPYLPEDVTVDEIGMNSHLVKELNINSANLVDIVLDVEDAFDVVLENEEMDEMQTVADAIALIRRKQEER